MEKNLAKTYAPKEFEDRIYEQWEKSGAFIAKVDPNKKPFTIVMPPPNITGQLHMGHALDQTLQDVLTRWKRMQGYSALWVPGTDHASIATEVKVADKLREETGKTKEEIGREEFLKLAWDWKKTYGDRITLQCRKLGDSCDWSRQRFTMDEGCSRAVTEMFVRLYEKGLIYKGKRLVNWCPSCGTSLSDAEVEHEDRDGSYWYFRYPGADGGEGIVVATSRPETMFGDVAIAVNPKDERYAGMVGKEVILPLVNRRIAIIADEYPDPEKGTGAVKITPAHDPNDFEVGQRHGLEVISCINADATMNENAGEYEGLDRYECRKRWVAALEEAGYLVKKEKMVIPMGECYRCGTVVESMLSDQWFVKMDGLAKTAIDASRSGALKYVPERFEKIHLHWLENIKDWCISRQLWWGHRIPAYYCGDCGEVSVLREAPERCPHCGSANIRQDEDVLDTWFSSGLWPFSTLGWPEKTKDLEYFYPTNVMVTGYDIIFFWVIRMVFSGIEVMGETPFEHVYIHGLVRDAQGRKMSKSLGNGIDPLEVIAQYGADALRFMLSTGITPGNDMRFQEEKLEAARNFANKLWNASRFVIMNLPEGAEPEDIEKRLSELRDEDKWLLSRVNEAAGYMTQALERFDLALAGQRAYDVIWNEFCDWYIEMVKPRLYDEDGEDKRLCLGVLVYSLKQLIRLLHPFMPFITEEIWAYLPHGAGEEHFLMHESWPKYDARLEFSDEVKRIETAMNVVKAARNIRAEASVAPGKRLSRASVLVAGEDGSAIEAEAKLICELAKIERLEYGQPAEAEAGNTMSAVAENVQLYIPMDELVDFEAEKERLEKEKKRLEGEVARCKGMLGNENFVKKAPAAKIEEEREKLAGYEDMLAKVSARLESMKTTK